MKEYSVLLAIFLLTFLLTSVKALLPERLNRLLVGESRGLDEPPAEELDAYVLNHLRKSLIIYDDERTLLFNGRLIRQNLSLKQSPDSLESLIEKSHDGEHIRYFTLEKNGENLTLAEIPLQTPTNKSLYAGLIRSLDDNKF